MQTYAEYRPTGFDAAGLGLPGRQDWIVCPVIQTRDSGCLETSNFAAALEILGGECETVEVHRFGHWGPGWYEIILVSPERAAAVEDIAAALENCPALDEDDLSEREHNEYIESWERWGYRDFTAALRTEFSLSWDAECALRDIDIWKLLNLYENAVPSGDYYSDSYGFRLDIACRNIERGELAAFLRTNRPRRGEAA